MKHDLGESGKDVVEVVFVDVFASRRHDDVLFRWRPTS